MGHLLGSIRLESVVSLAPFCRSGGDGIDPRLRGAGLIIAVDGVDERLEMARQMGADITLDFRKVDVVSEILKLTGGRGVDASIEALGLQSTFESALKVLKPGGTLSSLGVYSGISLFHSVRSVPGLATTRSSRHSARAARSVCVD